MKLDDLPRTPLGRLQVVSETKLPAVNLNTRATQYSLVNLSCIPFRRLHVVSETGLPAVNLNAMVGQLLIITVPMGLGQSLVVS